MVPECWSVAAVSRVKLKRCRPRKPDEIDGRPRETHTVSDTTTASVRATSFIVRRVAAKCGEPISSSSSQRKRMFTGTPASRAAFAP